MYKYGKELRKSINSTVTKSDSSFVPFTLKLEWSCILLQEPYTTHTLLTILLQGLF